MTEYYCNGCKELKEPGETCEECGTLLHPMELDATRNDELRELIERWRYEHELPAGQSGEYEVARTFEKCATELEELIDDE